MFLFPCFVLFYTFLVQASITEVDEFAHAIAGTADFAMHLDTLPDKIAHTTKYVMTLPDKSKEPQKDFTVAEVAQFDGKDGRPTYLIIDNYVYDFEEMIQYHPPGPEPIQKHAGRDATTAIRMSGMPPQAYLPVLQRFKVGQLIDGQKDNSTGVESAMKSVGSRL